LHGKITAEQWSKETLDFSMLLYKTGLELGRISMSKDVQLPEASVLFVRTVRELDKEIAKKVLR
jgi:hypothetical protein